MQNESTRKTGTRDEPFNLIGVLYHSLESAETTDKYIQDAGQTNGSAITQFPQETKEENTRRAG